LSYYRYVDTPVVAFALSKELTKASVFETERDDAVEEVQRETVAPEAVLDEIKGLRSAGMNDDCGETIEAVEQHGSFLLIRTGPRFAVVELRADRVYPIQPGEREGEPLTPEGLATAAAEAG
jgi:hypothetical protein